VSVEFRPGLLVTHEHLNPMECSLWKLGPFPVASRPSGKVVKVQIFCVMGPVWVDPGMQNPFGTWMTLDLDDLKEVPEMLLVARAARGHDVVLAPWEKTE